MIEARLKNRVRSIFASLVFLAPAILLAGEPPTEAPTATAEAAFEECRALMTTEVLDQAIARCEEAVRLDPKLPDAYFLLGTAHDTLWQKENSTSATPDASRIHRRKAAESYRKFLVLNQGDTELSRRARHTALSALLGIYIFGGEKEGDLEYANELARESSLTRRDLLILAAAYSRHERPDLSETFIKRQLESDPSDALACQSLAQLYNEPVWNGRSRFDDSIATLERCAAALDVDQLLFVDALQKRAVALRAARVPPHPGLATAMRPPPPPPPPQTGEAGGVVGGVEGGVIGGVVGGVVPDGVLRVGGDVKAPVVLQRVEPVYPIVALKARISGIVILEAVIDRTGAVKDVRVLEGLPFGLSEAAVDAVKQWTFAPATLNGKPVDVLFGLTVTFGFKIDTPKAPEPH